MLREGTVMRHDLKCELNRRACSQCHLSLWFAHCHCGSRAFPLCVGCRHAQHLEHRDTEPSTGEICQCDLCTEGEAA